VIKTATKSNLSQLSNHENTDIRIFPIQIQMSVFFPFKILTSVFFSFNTNFPFKKALAIFSV